MKKLPAFIGVALLLEMIASVSVYATWHGKKSYPERWDARILPIVHFVEAHRGLKFKHPVKVAFLSDDAFVDQVKSPPESARQRKVDDESLAEVRALGLVSGHPDLFKAQNDYVSASLVGLYVNRTKILYIRGTELTPYVRTTVAHELTHALQDQYFNLTAILRKAPDDSVARALIEGDAVRIQHAYHDQLSSADKQAYDQTESSFRDSSGSAAGGSIPKFIQEGNDYPYVFGPTYLDSLVADGGNERVNEAFRHPPVTDAQVVDPTDYPLTFTPRKLAPPSLPTGAQLLGRQFSFGQIGVLQVLGSALGYDVAWPAVQGWEGDAGQDYRLNGRICAALDVSMSGPVATKRILAALLAWRTMLPAARVSEHAGTVSVRSCDPGDTFKGRTVDPDPFEVLSARADVIDILVSRANWDFRGATCVVDHVIKRVGVVTFASDGSTRAEQATLRKGFQAAAQACS